MEVLAILVIVIILLIGVLIQNNVIVVGAACAAIASTATSSDHDIKNKIGGTIIKPGQKYTRYSGYEYTREELLSFTIDSDFVDALRTCDYRKINLSHLYYKNEPRTLLNRKLSDSSPRLPYTRKTGSFKRQLHWGQLKLFLTEIEFINLAIQRYGSDKQFYVLYVGAAPGNHTEALAAMYDNVYFDLWDGNPYVCKPKPGKIEIHQSLFFEKDAKAYKQKFSTLKINGQKPIILLVSDIRSASDEKAVVFDMGLQLDWWKIIEPDMCMYKFRLPWSPGKTTYADGEIYLQPFPGVTSSETRLIIDKAKTHMALKEYDNTKYEEQCFYHNNRERGQAYYPPTLFDTQTPLTLEKDGMCNCFDCMSMALIVQDYLNIIKQPSDLKHVVQFCHNLMRKTGGGTGGETLLKQTVANFKKAVEIGKNYTF